VIGEGRRGSGVVQAFARIAHFGYHWEMRLSALFLLALPAFVLLVDCKKEGPSAPLAPGGGYMGPTSTGPKRDSGSGSAGATGDEDAGSATMLSGKPLLIECVNVTPTSFVGEDTPAGKFVNAITMPADFSVSRVLTTWEKDCAQPTVRVEMTDGACPNGKDHSLVFRFDANAIAAHTIKIGLNSIVSDPGSGGIPISYVRPISLAPSGTWGTCPDAAGPQPDGTLDLIGVVDTKAGTTLEGRFDLDLGPCDGSAEPKQMVAGTFSALLRRGLKDVCP
jgi:hypothetical protein